MDKKFGRQQSEPTEIQRKSAEKSNIPKKKRFSLIEDALRNPVLQLEKGIEYLSDEDEEEDLEEIEGSEGEKSLLEKTNTRVNRKTMEERSSRPKERSSPGDKKHRRDSLPTRVDLSSQPEFKS